MIGLVLSSGDNSRPYDISSGVKQGCFLAPVIFNFFTCILNYPLHDSTSREYLRYRLDHLLFDLRQLNARTRVLQRLNMAALFTNDCTLMAHMEYELPTTVSRFAKDCCLFGVTVSLNKTKVMHQPASGSTVTCPSINIGGTS